uniref:Uncharacterized protein n=1 Tax=Arion vulgaris TaxID=1028688 RepID=A0A0B6Z8F2_9EUPU
MHSQTDWHSPDSNPHPSFNNKKVAQKVHSNKKNDWFLKKKFVKKKLLNW